MRRPPGIRFSSCGMFGAAMGRRVMRWARRQARESWPVGGALGIQRAVVLLAPDAWAWAGFLSSIVFLLTALFGWQIFRQWRRKRWMRGR